MADEPILARPPSATYQAGKFVRRHRGAVLAAAGFVALLVGIAVRRTPTSRHSTAIRISTPSLS